MAWPVDFPDAPIRDSYSSTAKHWTIRTNMDIGIAKSRPRFSTPLNMVQASYLITEAQRITFDTFYFDTLDAPFAWTDPVTGDGRTVRFTKAPDYRLQDATFWVVTVELEYI